MFNTFANYHRHRPPSRLACTCWNFAFSLLRCALRRTAFRTRGAAPVDLATAAERGDPAPIGRTGAGAAVRAQQQEVRLTAAGEHFAAARTPGAGLASQAAWETRDVARGIGEQLRVGFVGSSLYRGVPGAGHVSGKTPARARRHAGLNSGEQLQELQHARLDLGLVHSITPPEGISSQMLMEEPFMVCIPEGHALATRDAIDLTELQDERLILFFQPRSRRSITSASTKCAKHGVRAGNPPRGAPLARSIWFRSARAWRSCPRRCNAWACRALCSSPSRASNRNPNCWRSGGPRRTSLVNELLQALQSAVKDMDAASAT